jgi:hypothetical protein
MAANTDRLFAARQALVPGQSATYGTAAGPRPGIGCHVSILDRNRLLRNGAALVAAFDSGNFGRVVASIYSPRVLSGRYHAVPPMAGTGSSVSDLGLCR